MTAPTPTVHAGVRTGLGDAWAVAGRNLRHWIRQPRLLVVSTIQPVMFVLLFNYVFGGAIEVAADVDYLLFLLPGIYVQVVAFGATQTAVGLAEDLSKGMIDRFRSLPMARSAVLAGRTAADAVRGLFVVLLITVVGHAIGFRFQTGPATVVAGIALVVAFGFAMSWMLAYVGLVMGSAEATQAAGFLGVFPFVFASSAFVPTETMPGGLRVFAENQPVTAVVDAVRMLTVGGPVARPLLLAGAWILAILVLFVPLAVVRYRRAA